MSLAGETLQRAFAPLAEAVASERIPGGVLGVVEADGSRAVRAIGAAQTVPDRRPMAEGTWFDLASLTKVIFTTPRILELAATGRIDLDAPLTTAADLDGDQLLAPDQRIGLRPGHVEDLRDVVEGQEARCGHRCVSVRRPQSVSRTGGM
jgi:CubicO group peptidase (beta-lactamase class C family)